MKKSQRNMSRNGSSIDSDITQILLRKKRSATALSPLRYLPLVSALCWAYSSMASANAQCGPHLSPLPVVCTDATYPSGIFYEPTADFKLMVGPGVSIEPPDDNRGLYIKSGIGLANVTVVIDNTTIITQANNEDAPGDGVLVQQSEGSGNISIRADNFTISTKRNAGSPPEAASTGITAFISTGKATGDISIETSGGSIATDGPNSYGLYGVHNGNGDITINTTSNITTRGDRSDAAIANFPDLPSIRAEATGAATVIQAGGTIITHGQNSNGLGIFNFGLGTSFAEATGTINTVGENAAGVVVINYNENASTHVTARLVNTAQIATIGESSSGVYAAHLGSGLITVTVDPGSTITTTGIESHGAQARNMRGAVAMTTTGASVSTQGTDAVGLRAAPLGMGSPTSAAITSGAITTAGQNAHGIVAGVNNFGSGTEAYERSNVVTAGPITTHGMHAIGLVAVSKSNTTVTIGANIAAQNKFSTGVLATSTAGATAVTINDGVTIIGGWQEFAIGLPGGRFNTAAAGIVVGGATPSLIENHGTIGALSDRAIAASGVFNPTPGALTLDNHGTITGYLSQAGVGLATPFAFNNYSPNSFVLRHFADTDGDGVRETKRVAISDFGGAGAVFNNEPLGMLRFDEVTTNTKTETGGQYVPSTGFTPRPLEAGFYSIGREGVVQGHLVNLPTFNHAGTIDLRGPAVGNVLAITGNPNVTAVFDQTKSGVFVSNGGELISNVLLNAGIAPGGQTNSYADMLVVDRTELGTGATRVTVHNQAGLGGLTTGNGIELIEVRDKVTPGASAPGAFALSAPVAASAYTYQLQQHGTGGDAADGNWYLRSSIPDPGPGPDPKPDPVPGPDPGPDPDPGPTPDPNPGPDPTPAPDPGPNPGPGSGPNPMPAPTPDKPLTTYRPQVPVYMAAPALASRIGLDMLGTYHDRLGEDYSHSTPATGAKPKAGWGRIYGGNLKTKLQGAAANRLDQFERYGPAFTLNTYGMQAGADLYRKPHTDYSDVAGAYLGYSHGKADVQNVLDSSAAGNVKIDAYSLGGYWTRKGASGWYLDGVLQATLYSSIKAQSQGQRLNTRGWGLAASAEAGYPIDVGAGWKFEPQAQLIYQYIKLKNASDDFGQVRYANRGAMHARIGARLDKTFTTASGQPFTPWLRVNLWRSPEQRATTTFTTTAGTHPTTLTTNLGGTWAQFGAGISGQMTKNTSVFASADYNRNIGGQKAHGITGRLGLKIAW